MTRIIIGLLIAAALQFGFLISTIGGRINLLTNGTQMTLKALPVDPRDLFRGDYVILNYNISTIKASEIKLPKDLEPGQHIWVLMEPSKENPQAPWHAVSVLSKYDSQHAGHLIKGTIISHHNRNPDWSKCTDTTCGYIRVSYGLGKFFLPEGTGKELEKARNAKNLSVLIAIGDDGTAAIKGLNKNGTLLYEEPLF